MIKGIKPFLSLEFFLAEVKIASEDKQVTTLVKRVLGDRVKHPEFTVNCVAVIETAAEKWVGLTRRVATCAHRKYYHDPNLVRHLYDLYKIDELGYFSDEFTSLVSRIVRDDQKRYKKHNDDYYRDPVSEIRRAVDELHQSAEWRENWDEFVKTMVFSRDKPTYDDALGNLQNKTELALAALR